MNLVSRFRLPDLFIYDIRLTYGSIQLFLRVRKRFFTGKLFRADWIFIQSFFPLYLSPPFSRFLMEETKFNVETNMAEFIFLLTVQLLSKWLTSNSMRCLRDRVRRITYLANVSALFSFFSLSLFFVFYFRSPLLPSIFPLSNIIDWQRATLKFNYRWYNARVPVDFWSILELRPFFLPCFSRMDIHGVKNIRGGGCHLVETKPGSTPLRTPLWIRCNHFWKRSGRWLESIFFSFFPPFFSSSSSFSSFSFSFFFLSFFFSFLQSLKEIRNYTGSLAVARYFVLKLIDDERISLGITMSGGLKYEQLSWLWPLKAVLRCG